jgi:organic radical activating enzyme
MRVDARHPSAAKAALVEVFDSIQGEGRFVGAPMAFVRVATCPLRCNYCDTPYSYVAAADFPVRANAGTFREANPVGAARAADLVRTVAGTARPRHPVSVTGGEPLVYPEFIAALGSALGPSFPLHLETAAIDADALRACLPVLAHVSADYKLPETVQGQDLAARHVACVATACAAGVTVDVKIVLTADVSEVSFARALRVLAPFAGTILLVLQPVTPFGAVTTAMPGSRLQDCLARAQAAGFNVRVLPQVHKALHVP